MTTCGLNSPVSSTSSWSISGKWNLPRRVSSMLMDWSDSERGLDEIAVINEASRSIAKTKMNRSKFATTSKEGWKPARGYCKSAPMRIMRVASAKSIPSEQSHPSSGSSSSRRRAASEMLMRMSRYVDIPLNLGSRGKVRRGKSTLSIQRFASEPELQEFGCSSGIPVLKRKSMSIVDEEGDAENESVADIIKMVSHMSTFCTATAHPCAKLLYEYIDNCTAANWGPHKHRRGLDMRKVVCFILGMNENEDEINAIVSNYQNDTLLHIAARKGFVEVVRLLLKHNARSVPNSNGDTPLHVACAESGRIHKECEEQERRMGSLLCEIVDLLVKHHSGDGNGDEIGYNVEKCGNVCNLRNNAGNTPLHLAGYAPIVAKLIEHNANLCELNHAKETPLLTAARRGNRSACQLLIQKGNLLGLGDKGGNTPLHVAAQNGYNNIVGLLLLAGADMEVTNCAGETPLHVASEFGYYQIAESLLNARANVDALDKNGCTPLLCASMNGRKSVVGVLLRSNTDILAECDGRNALDYAMEGEHNVIVGFLMEAQNRLKKKNAEPTPVERLDSPGSGPRKVGGTSPRSPSSSPRGQAGFPGLTGVVSPRNGTRGQAGFPGLTGVFSPRNGTAVAASSNGKPGHDDFPPSPRSPTSPGGGRFRLPNFMVPRSRSVVITPSSRTPSPRTAQRVNFFPQNESDSTPIARLINVHSSDTSSPVRRSSSRLLYLPTDDAGESSGNEDQKTPRGEAFASSFTLEAAQHFFSEMFS